MPRKNRRSDEPGALDEESARRGVERVQASPDGEWLVRHITADGATKTYRCPGCDHEIAPGMPHVVAWPADERGDSHRPAALAHRLLERAEPPRPMARPAKIPVITSRERSQSVDHDLRFMIGARSGYEK